MALKSITVKLDARMTYYAELLARMQTKSFTKYVGELIAADLTQYEFNDVLWSEYESDRLALIGNRMPQLLNTRQRILWTQVICADQMYWLVPITGKPIEVNSETFNFPLLRDVWPYINRNQDAVMEQANALVAQLDIQIRRITHDPGSQWKMGEVK